MQTINYSFSSLISFSGLLIGLALVKIAPEEQKPLEKYMALSGNMLLFMIFVFPAFYYFNEPLNLIALAGYSVFLLFMQYRIGDRLKKSMIIYTALGILFFLSSKNANLFTIESSLILLYGIPTASLICRKKEKNQNRVIFYNIGFLIIANLLLLV